MLEYTDKKIAVDDDGCLVHVEEWDENVARSLAAHHGIELTDAKLDMIKFIKDHYKSYNFFPLLRSVCRSAGQQRDCLHEQFISPLVAWKIAGLPHPDEFIVSLLDAGQSPG